MPKTRRHLYQQSTWGPGLERLMAASRNCRTRMALSKRSGVGLSTIGRIVRGDSNPQTGTVAFLAEALGVSFEALAAAAAGQKIDNFDADELAMDRVDRALGDFRRQINNSIDQLRDFVRAQRCWRPAEASADEPEIKP